MQLAREFFEALIAEDYAKAGQLLSGLPADRVPEILEKLGWGGMKFIRIVLDRRADATAGARRYRDGGGMPGGGRGERRQIDQDVYTSHARGIADPDGPLDDSRRELKRVRATEGGTKRGAGRPPRRPALRPSIARGAAAAQYPSPPTRRRGLYRGRSDWWRRWFRSAQAGPARRRGPAARPGR